MSFVPQETDPLLANPNRPSKTQNVPRAVDPADGQAHIDASSELDSDDEAMGTWGTRDERSKWRQRIDYFALGCILLGAVLFVGVVWYIVWDNQLKKGGLGEFSVSVPERRTIIRVYPLLQARSSGIPQVRVWGLHSLSYVSHDLTDTPDYHL